MTVTYHFLFEVETPLHSWDFRAGQGEGMVRKVWRAASSAEAETAEARCSPCLRCLAQASGGRSASESHRHPLGAAPEFRHGDKYHSRQVKPFEWCLAVWFESLNVAYSEGLYKVLL